MDYDDDDEHPSSSDAAPNHYCDGCDSIRNFPAGDDGFYYCLGCGAQSKIVFQTAVPEEAFIGSDGIYNPHYKSQCQNPQNPNRAEEEPRDFGSRGVCTDVGKLGDGIRMRYVEGLQLVLQWQCEALVDKCGVSPYIVGVMPTVWLRYVAMKRVLGDEWVETVLRESDEAAAKNAGRATMVKEADYTKDLLSYLKHCKDFIFAGSTKSHEEQRLIERLWDMYEKRENVGAKDEKQVRVDVSINNTLNLNKGKEENFRSKTQMEEDITVENRLKEEPFSLLNFPASTNAAVEKMKLEMEEDRFEYLPPRPLRKVDGYRHYKRQKIDEKFRYVAPADYYILLRACAKLVQLKAQIMHRSVLSLESRLEWIDKLIDELFDNKI